MTLPGHRIRRWTSRAFNEATMARVIEPTLADLQLEYARAHAAGRVWRARWVRMWGYATCARVVALAAMRDVRRAAISPSPADQQLARRVVITTAICLAVVTTLFTAATALLVVGWEGLISTPWLAVTLVPQVLPRAVPVALAIGVALAVSTQPPTRYVTAIALALALSGTAVSFVSLNWAGPMGARAFRHAAGWTGPEGSAEMTLGMLHRGVQVLTAAQESRPSIPGVAQAAGKIEATYYLRLALPFAPLVLVTWLLASRRSTNRFAAASHAAVGCGLYFWLTALTAAAAAHSAIAPAILVWMPNLAFFAAALASIGVRRRYRVAGA
jgi:lipopolysaccharide export LptBFGC system permease protein LptF